MNDCGRGWCEHGLRVSGLPDEDRYMSESSVSVRANVLALTAMAGMVAAYPAGARNGASENGR